MECKSVAFCVIFSHQKLQYNPKISLILSSLCASTSGISAVILRPTVWPIYSLSAVCFCSIGHSKQINNCAERSDSAGLRPPSKCTVLCCSLSEVRIQSKSLQFVQDKLHTDCLTKKHCSYHHSKMDVYVSQPAVPHVWKARQEN